MKQIIIFLVSLQIGLAACSSSKTVSYQSKWKSHSLFYEQAPTDASDMNSRLKFGVQNNSEKLFASISTREPEIVSRIISSGVRLSIKPEGEKRKPINILFPVVLKEDRRAIRKMEQVEMLGPSMQLLLDTFNKEALVNRGNGDRFVNLINNSDEFYCKINMTPDGELSIDYALSLADINPGNRQTLEVKVEVEGGSRSGGFAPGVSIGMGAGSYGGMGGMGVGIGTGGRNAYGNQTIELKLNVNLANAPQ